MAAGTRCGLTRLCCKACLEHLRAKAPAQAPSQEPAAAPEQLQRDTAGNTCRAIHTLARSNTCSNNINNREEAVSGRGAH